MSTIDVVHELHEQLDWHWQHAARTRLNGLSDEEYLWEPVAHCLSVRPRDVPSADFVTMRAGSGEWVCEAAYPEPDPVPVSTIAWRLAHLIVGVLGARVHSHFGGPPISYQEHAYAGSADEALAQLDAGYAAWSAGVRSLTAEALGKPVGPAEHIYAESPMITLVLHIHREMIHHLAEIALLRDLWAHREGAIHD